MTQTSARPLLVSHAALAPLARTDLPSFAVALPSRLIVEATPACAALGLAVGEEAPAALARTVKGLSRNQIKTFGFARLLLPGAFVPRLFRYAPVLLASGPAVLFADPGALDQATTDKALPRRIRETPPHQLPVAATAQAGPLRISFETDADDRVRRLSPQFAEALGARAGAILGQTFAALEAEGLMVSNGALAAALASGGSFSDIAVEVPPLGPDEAALELELGGVPLMDSARRRRAILGFGLMRGQIPPAPLPEAVPARPVGAGDAPIRAQNVVPLRGGGLSPQERSAFREIARTLAAAIEDWPKPKTVPSLLGSDDADGVSVDAAEAGLMPAEPGATDAPVHAETDLLDRLPVGLIVQQDGDLAFANQTLLRLSGWADLPALKATGGLGRVLEREPSGALCLVNADGRRLPVEVRLVAAPFMGRPALLHVIRQIDVDDAREARAVARREALDMVPCPVFLLEAEGTIRVANRAAAERFGFAALDLAGEPFTIAVAPEDRGAAIAALDRAASGGAAEEVMLTLRDSTGVTFAGRVGIGRAGADQHLLCAVVSAVVADPIETQAAPDRLPHLARRMMESLGQPIDTALSYAERHATATDRFPGEVTQALSTLRHSLGDLAALATPVPDVAPGPCNLTDLVRAAIAGLVPAARRRRLVLRSDLPEALTVTARVPHLARLVRMMIEEAVEATPAGGTVAVSLFRDEDMAGQACLQVSDGGEALDEVTRAAALAPLENATGLDRFSLAGRPLRAARLSSEAEALGGVFSLRPDLTRGMIARLTLP